MRGAAGSSSAPATTKSASGGKAGAGSGTNSKGGAGASETAKTAKGKGKAKRARPSDADASSNTAVPQLPDVPRGGGGIAEQASTPLHSLPISTPWGKGANNAACEACRAYGVLPIFVFGQAKSANHCFVSFYVASHLPRQARDDRDEPYHRGLRLFRVSSRLAYVGGRCAAAWSRRRSMAAGVSRGRATEVETRASADTMIVAYTTRVRSAGLGVGRARRERDSVGRCVRCLVHPTGPYARVPER